MEHALEERRIPRPQPVSCEVASGSRTPWHVPGADKPQDLALDGHQAAISSRWSSFLLGKSRSRWRHFGERVGQPG